MTTPPVSSSPDQRYFELLAVAQGHLDEYDIDGSKRFLDLVEYRRNALGIEATLAELELREAWQETNSDYPVPPGKRRREPAPGCGDAACDICYR